jgi:hypothetical protein
LVINSARGNRSCYFNLYGNYFVAKHHQPITSTMNRQGTGIMT